MINNIMINCPKCNTLFDEQGKWGIKQFCSRSCANSRGPRSQEFKDTVSAKLSGKVRSDKPNKTKGRKIAARVDRNCPECNTMFNIISLSKQIYCSKECRTPHIGGYRQGSGRSKSGYYKGIYCGSTYELAWVIYRLDHNLPVKRFDGYILYGDNRKYYPDFIDDSCIIEIKGWTTVATNAIVEHKILASTLAGYKVLVLKKEDLKKEFSWIKVKYNTDKIYTLYDKYRPTFNYICNHCNVEFGRDHQIKTENKFCSRVCAGLASPGRKRVNISVG